MKILVDISHPAHVHFFRNACDIWQKHGHEVKIVSRDKDVTLKLLDDFGYSHQPLSKKGEGFFGLAKELIIHESRLAKIAHDFKADVILEIGGTFIVHAGRLLGIKTCVFTDTEHAKLSNKITFPFATYVITPDIYIGNIGSKQVRYKGYQELAYLHPNQFKPNPLSLKDSGLEEDEKFFILRFVSWGASHDVGQQGLSEADKLRLVNGLKKYGKVLITSEAPLPKELEPYRIRISPTKIHDLLHYASLYVGEGATMASEAAQLGTPSIYINTLILGYINELSDKYQLIYSFTEGELATDKALELAEIENLKEIHRERQKQMLAEKIDVTAWMVEFVENIN